MPEKKRRKGPVSRGQLGGSEGGDSAPSGSVKAHFEYSLRILCSCFRDWDGSVSEIEKRKLMGGFEGDEKRENLFLRGFFFSV